MAFLTATHFHFNHSAELICFQTVLTDDVVIEYKLKKKRFMSENGFFDFKSEKSYNFLQ